MGIWIELGVFVLALAFGLWQIQDVKKAREASARRRAEAQAQGEDQAVAQVDAGTPGAEAARPENTRPPV